jgi:ubiquitin C-terminal hydrolase
MGYWLISLSLEKIERALDLELVLRALSKHMPSSWMLNPILLDNVQAKLNLLKFDFIKFTYNSMYINCVL